MPLTPDEIASLVDLDAGTVAGRAFADEAIYELELERVFARSWSFLCDGRELAEPGQFVSTFTGEDPVSVVRQPDGSTVALLNSCRHRGLPVCGLSGRADQLTCGYHGWTYSLDGRLTGLLEPDEEFERWAVERRLALVPITRTREVAGLLFGAWDASWDRDDGALAAMAPDVVSLRAHGSFTRHGRPLVIEKNWKVVAEALAVTAAQRGGSMLFPTFFLLPDWHAAASIHPKGPGRAQVWVSTTLTSSGDLVEALGTEIETQLQPEGPRPVVLNLKTPATASEGCPADDAPVALPPRRIDEGAAASLYRAWREHMVDERPLAGLQALA